MKIRVQPGRLVGFCVLVASLFAFGCQSASVGGAGAPAALTPVEVVKGMPAADLIAALGEPLEVRPVEPQVEGADGEVWIYRKSTSNVDMKVTGTKETPYFNPITGAYEPIMDPVYKAETSTYRVETQFLIMAGVVQGWKVDQKRDRDYN